jgi:uncharacterized membrane protein YfcA
MDPISTADLIIYSVTIFFASILGGIAGAGGGFLVTPLLIFIGLTPAQAVATGKVTGVTVSIGSLTGLRGIKPTSRRQLFAIIGLSVVIGLLAPFVITRLDSEFYRRALGLLLLAMIPLLIWKRVGKIEHSPSTTKRALGYVLLTVSIALQAVFSGGLGSLVSIVLMAFLGMPALMANVTRRYSHLVLNSILVLGLLFSGLIVWKVAVIGMGLAGLGGYIGSKIAIKKGNAFVMTIFIVLMFVSAIELLFG